MTMPPASVTINAPAATSQHWSPSIWYASATPIATWHSARAAEPSTRMLWNIKVLYHLVVPCLSTDDLQCCFTWTSLQIVAPLYFMPFCSSWHCQFFLFYFRNWKFTLNISTFCRVVWQYRSFRRRILLHMTSCRLCSTDLMSEL